MRTARGILLVLSKSRGESLRPSVAQCQRGDVSDKLYRHMQREETTRNK